MNDHRHGPGKEPIIWRRSQALLLLIAGFLIWSLAFVALYAVLSLGCRYGWAGGSLAGVSVLRLALIAVWALHLAASTGLLALVLRLRRAARHVRAAADRDGTAHSETVRKDIEHYGTGRTLAGITLGLTLAALVATVWIGAPVLALDLCR